MLTIKACRKLLGKSGEKLSARGCEEKRNQYYAVAYLLFDIWNEKRKEAVLIRIELNPAYRFATQISTQAS